MDLRVLICARCAKVLSEGDRGTEVSGPEVSQVQRQRLEMKDHGLDVRWVGLGSLYTHMFIIPRPLYDSHALNIQLDSTLCPLVQHGDCVSASGVLAVLMMT